MFFLRVLRSASASPAKAPRNILRAAPPSVLAASLAMAMAMAMAVPAASQTVERVVDGDTIIVAGVGRVRLIGVDTPETVHPNRPVEFFGKEASEFTKNLLEGKYVHLEYDQERQDRYGRTLAYVYLADGTHANAEIIRRGYGHAYTRFPFRHMEAFRQFEREARTNRRGLWGTAVGGSGTGGGAGEARSSSTPTRTYAKPPPGVPSTVFVTRTGKKYHIDGCRFLSKSKLPMPRDEAAESYELCGVCAAKLRQR